MGQRGPAPRHPDLRVIGGRRSGVDSGGRPVAPAPPFDTSAPEPPAWLTPYAREVWDLSVTQVARLKITKPEDFAALAAYCLAVDQLRAATADIEARGYVHESIKEGVEFIAPGDPAFAPADPSENRGYFRPWPIIERKPNPSVATRNLAMTQIKALGGLFGFSPAAVNAVTGPRGREGDDGNGNPFAGTA